MDAIWRPEHTGVPGGETLAAFAERVGGACEDIVAPHAGEAIAIVSHSGATDGILRWAMSIPIDSAWCHEFDFPNAAIVELLVWPQGRHPEGSPRYARHRTRPQPRPPPHLPSQRPLNGAYDSGSRATERGELR